MLKRTVVGVLLALVLAAMLYFGPVVQAVVLTIGAILAVYEINNALKQAGYRPSIAPAYLFAALFGVWILLLPDIPLLLLFALCIMFMMLQYIFKKERVFKDCLAGMFGMVYPALLFALLLETGVRFENGLGTSALLLAFACPLMGDIFAYFVGSFLGKHPLCPAISPKKTVEGSLAAFVGGVVGGMLVFLLQPLFGTAHVPLWLCAVAGFVCAFTGQVGDLFASSIKRAANIKDYGRLFPGHGGVLDRLDSVLLSAPVVYFLVMLYTVYAA